MISKSRKPPPLLGLEEQGREVLLPKLEAWERAITLSGLA